MRAASVVSGSLLAAVFGLVVAAPGLAWGDTLQATRYEMVERSDVVELRVDRGFATLVVQRTVANPGPKSDQATFMLEIPATAVATRLRTSGVNAKGEVVWFEGELLEAEAAAKKYEELTGIGGYYPKDPALLSWRHEGLLALQVFPVPARSTKTVEYTLKMPLTYEAGAYHLELPEMGTDTLRASLRVSAVHATDGLTVNGVAAAPGGGPVATRADRVVSIELRPRGVAAVEAAFASVPISEGKHLVRGRIDAAPHLAEAPVGAHVVVLFDGSRSNHAADAGLAAVRAYLGHMTGATVDFLTFDREVRAPIGRSLPVAAALSKLASFALEPRNGSRIDDALARADAILQKSQAPAKRVLVITDTLTRSEITPEKVGAASWRSGALVHVALINGGDSANVARDDESPWGALPRRTGGLFWAGNAPSVVDAATRVVFEEWARPKRIDKLAVRGVSGDFVAPATLDEGAGLEHFVIADAPTALVQIRGELWSRPLSVATEAAGDEGKLAAALLFGSPLWSTLTESEQMKMAVLGGAVSPVTSYLAIEPGVRPSNEGLDWGATGQGFGSGTGHAFGVGTARLFGGGERPAIDKSAWLAARLRVFATACAPAAQAVSAVIESTLDEVVDVTRVELAPSRDAKAESCVSEKLWGLALPASTFDVTFESHAVSAKL